jgi:hypothetical protein
VFKIFEDIMTMNSVQVEVRPLSFERVLLRRKFFTRRPYMDYNHPVESLAGFSLSKADFDLLAFYKVFTDVEGALLGEEKRSETPGEKTLGCEHCEMMRAGNRPHLSPREERYEGRGFADSWAILCYGLMASNRPVDSEIPCLRALSGKNPIKLEFEVTEE